MIPYGCADYALVCSLMPADQGGHAVHVLKVWSAHAAQPLENGQSSDSDLREHLAQGRGASKKAPSLVQGPHQKCPVNEVPRWGLQEVCRRPPM